MGMNDCILNTEWQNINAVRGLLYAALPDVGVECGLGNAAFQNLRGFDDPIVLLKKQIEPFTDCHATTSFSLILYPRSARKQPRALEKQTEAFAPACACTMDEVFREKQNLV